MGQLHGVKLLNDDTTNKLLQFIDKMTDDKDDMKFKCATFNGDTADGRTKWPDWLRDIELLLDEWSWAVMSNEVLSHDMYERLDDKKKLKEDEEKAIKIMMDMACKSRAATKGRKTTKEWRKEMENDRDTFLAFVRATEKYILLLLQRNTGGEARKIVSGIHCD